MQTCIHCLFIDAETQNHTALLLVDLVNTQHQVSDGNHHQHQSQSSPAERRARGATTTGTTTKNTVQLVLKFL